MLRRLFDINRGEKEKKKKIKKKKGLVGKWNLIESDIINIKDLFPINLELGEDYKFIIKTIGRSCQDKFFYKNEIGWKEGSICFCCAKWSANGSLRDLYIHNSLIEFLTGYHIFKIDSDGNLTIYNGHRKIVFQKI